MLQRVALLGALVSFSSPLVGPEISAPPRVLLVVGEGPLREADEQLRRRLAEHGYEVATAPGGALRMESARGARVLVLSPSVSPAAAPRAGITRIPVVALNALAFPGLGLSVDRLHEDF